MQERKYSSVSDNENEWGRDSFFETRNQKTSVSKFLDKSKRNYYLREIIKILRGMPVPKSMRENHNGETPRG